MVEPGVLPEGACPLGLGSGGAYPPEQLGEPAEVRCAAAAGSGGRAPAGRSAGPALRGSSAAADRSSRQPSNPQQQPQQQHQQQQQQMAMLPAAHTPSPPQHALPSPQTAPPLQSPQSMAPQASTQQQQPGPQGLLRPPAVHPPPSQQQRALPLVQPRALASQPGLQQAAGRPAPRAAASGAAPPLRPLLPNLLLPGALPPSRAPPPPRPCSLPMLLLICMAFSLAVCPGGDKLPPPSGPAGAPFVAASLCAGGFLSSAAALPSSVIGSTAGIPASLMVRSLCPFRQCYLAAI